MTPPITISPTPDQEMVESLQNAGLLENVEAATFEALSGGVSSDIWRVEADSRVYCVKRALAKLKVEADWFAPLERSKASRFLLSQNPRRFRLLASALLDDTQAYAQHQMHR